MARHLGLIGCLVVVATILVGGATAETYTVGDDLMWKVPPGGPIAYSTWANKHTFEIGDTLVFNWTGNHNVVKVPQADFNSCTAANPIGSIQTISPANFTLEANGTHYFICTIEDHCYFGQKLAVTTGKAASTPWWSRSAPSLATGAFSAVLMALAISFMSYM